MLGVLSSQGCDTAWQEVSSYNYLTNGRCRICCQEVAAKIICSVLQKSVQRYLSGLDSITATLVQSGAMHLQLRFIRAPT